MSQVCISETICEYDRQIYKISENPLEVIKNADPEFFTLLENTRHTALSESSVPMKYKFLIAMSLGGPAGAMNGVQSLAIGVMNKEATKEEVMETLCRVQYTSGAGSVYMVANSLKDRL